MSLKYAVSLPDIVHWQKQVKCQAACPIHTDAGRYVQLIAEKRYREAYLVARSPNPFASVCGRVCAAPCEDFCRRGSIDKPVTIRALKRFVTEKYGVESLEPDTQQELSRRKSGSFGLEQSFDFGDNKLFWHLPNLARVRKGDVSEKKVAVIGAGPAGLACAHDLAVIGYKVTVFERTDVLGGMMRHGIPEFRLPRTLIEKEIRKITDLGVEVLPFAPLTKNFGIGELRREGFEAVFIAVGTQEGRDIDLEGANMEGVVKAIDFLVNVNAGRPAALGKRVLVVGGGFVAFDAARTALRAALEADERERLRDGRAFDALDAARSARRAGVLEVHVASLESFEEMPVLRSEQGKEEFEEAVREGIRFHPQRGIKRFISEDTKIKAVEFVGVKRTYDEKGRFDPVYDSSVSEIMDADTVIMAIGQKPRLDFIKPEDGIELSRAGTIIVEPVAMSTTAPGVFAGGDVAFGPRNLIDAIANGKQVALSIDDYLRGIKTEKVFRLGVEKIPIQSYDRPFGYETLQRRTPETAPLERRTGIVEVEQVFSEEGAREQAERCVICHIQTIYDAEKCVLCGSCVDVCPEYCLKLVPVESLEFSELGMEDLARHYNFDSLEPISAMIKNDEKCIRCGLCAMVCPTEAMTMERMHYSEEEIVKLPEKEGNS